MRLFPVSLLLIAVVLLSASCSQQESPEEVVRQWQDHVDKNEFDEARALSTSRTIEFINWMEQMMIEMGADSTIIETHFQELICEERGDRAVCHYLLKEDGMEFRDSFVLQRVGGHWLVHIPEEQYDDDASLEELMEILSQDSLLE